MLQLAGSFQWPPSGPTSKRFAARAAALVVPGVLSLGAFAAEPKLPYVPTPQEVVDKMLAMAKVTPNDFLADRIERQQKPDLNLTGEAA